MSEPSKPQTNTDIILAEHDAHITGMRTEITEIKTKIDTLISNMQTLVVATSRNPFDMGKTLSITKDGIIIIGAACAFVIWIATGHFAADWARQIEFNKQIQIDIQSLRSNNSP